MSLVGISYWLLPMTSAGVANLTCWHPVRFSQLFNLRVNPSPFLHSPTQLSCFESSLSDGYVGVIHYFRLRNFTFSNTMGLYPRQRKKLMLFLNSKRRAGTAFTNPLTLRM